MILHVRDNKNTSILEMWLLSDSLQYPLLYCVLLLRNTSPVVYHVKPPSLDKLKYASTLLHQPFYMQLEK